MLQSIQIAQFAQSLFDSDDAARHANPILKAILEGRSARVSDIAQHLRGSPEANYKHIQRFIQKVDTKETLLRLFQAEAPFVIGDATEMPRPHAYRTPYVGTLKDGKTKGFWLLLLATPYRGRALPCHFLTYSSRTIAATAESRNLNHLQAFAPLKTLLGDKPLVWLAYTPGMLVSEESRNVLFGAPLAPPLPSGRTPKPPHPHCAPQSKMETVLGPVSAAQAETRSIAGRISADRSHGGGAVPSTRAITCPNFYLKIRNSCCIKIPFRATISRHGKITSHQIIAFRYGHSPQFKSVFLQPCSDLEVPSCHPV